MKNGIRILLLISIAALHSSCDKDEFSYSPNASFSGEIRDKLSGELVQQEVREGSRIYYIEQGWTNPPVQSMRFKSDGTFENRLMFAGEYKVILNRGNFSPIDTMSLTLRKGDNRQVFEVLPYITIVDPKIELVGNEVVATFRLQQNTSSNTKSISLFAHPDMTVSNNIKDTETKQDINVAANPATVYTLKMDVRNNSKIAKGRDYYFRIGALSSVGEAKFNYSIPVNINLK